MSSRLIILAIAVLSAAPTSAASRPAWVIAETLNVRERPTTDSPRIGSVSRGERVEVTAFREDRWCKALLPSGKSGWLKEEHLQFSAEKGRELAREAGKTDAPPAWVEPHVVNMRKGPALGTDVITRLKRGAKVYVVDREGEWRKVKSAGNGYGWIRADLLEFDIEKGRELAEGSPGQSGGPREAWVNVNVANVRSGPSAGYSRTGQLTRGSRVEVLEEKGDWLKCKGSGCSGWVSAELLETDAAKGRALAAGGSSARDKAYCIGSNVRLRSGPDTGRKAVAKIKEGTTLWIEDEEKGWCKVKTEGGDAGWIAGWYVRRHGANTTVSEPPDLPQPTAPGSDFPSPDRPPEDGKLQPFKAWIGEDHTNVRYGPDTDKDVKLQLDKFTPVEVVDTSGQWCKIRTESGTYGWTAGWVLDFQPPGHREAGKVIDGEREEVKVGWVSRPVVNVRKAPTTDSDALTKVDFGSELVIIDQQADWFKVALKDGTSGWIAGRLIETRAERLADRAGPLGAGGSSQGRSVVTAAMRHLGKPYVRGASGPNTFDCSGFTSYIYRQFGINLPRTSTGQARQGRPVSRDALAQGDVVIFKNTYRSGISHVGIYIGQGQFIHASNSRSGVKLTRLDSSYYAPRFVCARRLF